MLLTRAVGGRETIACACGLSRAAGVRAGMDLAQARALLPEGCEALVAAGEPAREARALGSLARWMLRVSPRVAVDAPDGLLADVSGTEHLYRTEERLLRSLRRALWRLGLQARLASAGTYAGARAVSRGAGAATTVVAPGQESQALSGLAPEALGLEAQTLSTLEALNIRRVGQILEIPRASRAARLGLGLLRTLDRTLGLEPEVLEFVRPAEPVRERMDFAGPTTHAESIAQAVKQTLGRFTAVLRGRSLGVRHLALRLERARRTASEGPEGKGAAREGAEELEILLSRASASERHLWSLLSTRLERVDTERGEGIEAVELIGVRCERLRPAQMLSPDLGGGSGAGGVDALGLSDDERAAELLDTLIARLGHGRVLRPELCASHLPERSVRLRPASEPARAMPQGALADDPRPTVLLEKPERTRVTAMSPEGPIVQVDWRGTVSAVSRCVGPERLGAEWWRWDAPPPDREYFAVQIEDGRWLWVFRQAGTGRWFVHGVWA